MIGILGGREDLQAGKGSGSYGVELGGGFDLVSTGRQEQVVYLCEPQ